MNWFFLLIVNVSFSTLKFCTQMKTKSQLCFWMKSSFKSFLLNRSLISMLWSYHQIAGSGNSYIESWYFAYAHNMKSKFIAILTQNEYRTSRYTYCNGAYSIEYSTYIEFDGLVCELVAQWNILWKPNTLYRFY